jgi:hypothetical protein
MNGEPVGRWIAASRQPHQFIYGDSWLQLCATDGHAKNFSIFLEPEGRFRLTPRYDVLSALPVLGTKAGRLSPPR